MAEVTSKYVAYIASVLGLVQGVAWFLMSILVILLYTEIIKVEIDLTTINKTFNSALYAIYFMDGDDDIIVTPLCLLICAVFYIILSIFWIAFSIRILSQIPHIQKVSLKAEFLGIGITILITSLMDLILTILLGRDYAKLSSFANEQGLEVFIINLNFLNAIATVMTIAARGYTLWIVNVLVAIYLVYHSNKMQHNSKRSTVNAFPHDIHHTPSIQEGTTNRSFIWETTPKNFLPTNSYGNLQQYGMRSSVNAERVPDPRFHNERLAKISKPSNRSPPFGTSYKAPTRGGSSNASYIYPRDNRVPSPDYSPPNSPMQQQLKSALKNRSINVYGNNENYY